MKVTQLNSATVLIEDINSKVKILCDPWLIGEEYLGSWSIYPPYNFKPENFADVDFIYVSHIHPDHVSTKTLSKLNDRILNARNTMIVREKAHFNRVLLIDDAVGSGSTLNEISKQMKDKNVCNHVIGCAITGSFKGFEVLNEV